MDPDPVTDPVLGRAQYDPVPGYPLNYERRGRGQEVDRAHTYSLENRAKIEVIKCELVSVSKWSIKQTHRISDSTQNIKMK